MSAARAAVSCWLLVASVAASAARAEEPAPPRTSIKIDPFADEDEETERPPEPEAPAPDHAPAPKAAPAAPAPPPAAPSAPAPAVLVFIRPASPADAARALALGDAAAAAVAARRGLRAVSVRDALDPEAARRARRAHDDAIRGVERGREALEALDLVAASASLEEGALALGALDALDRGGEAALHEALLGLAVAALYDGDLLRADGCFVALAAVVGSGGPQARLLAEIDLYPSKVIGRLETVRAELESRPTGRIEVISEPPGAVVRVDGIERGQAPMELGGLAEGMHLVALGGPGFVPVSALVDVVEGQVVPVRRALAPSPLAAQLDVVPRDDAPALVARWADARGVRWAFVGEQSALGTVRGVWLDARAPDGAARVEVVPKGDGGAAIAEAIEAAEAAARAPVLAAVEPEAASEGLTGRWWFWAGVGGAVAVVAASAAILVATESGGPPRTTAIFGF